MSDYMFRLESHLTGEQFRVVGQVQAIASKAGVSLYLTGGAMRDVFAGFPARDLDFTTESTPAKLAKPLEKHGGVLVSTDDRKKSIHLKFPGGVTVEIGMAHTEKFGKPGAAPQITPSTIHEDLQCRDFTVNAVALSLNKASLGLIIDPANGMGDIERKELRTISNYAFYDDPARILRLIRLKIRMGYQIDERTRMQLDNAREAGMLDRITPEALGEELRAMAAEVNSHDLVKALEDEKLLQLFSPVLAGGKVNYATLQRLQKAHQMVPFGIEFKVHPLPLFLETVLEKLNAKEQAALMKATGITRPEISAMEKLGPAAKKMERTLMGGKLQKASLLYQVLMKTPGEQILHLAVFSNQRIVQDRIKNFFTKHLPAALEITNEMVTATGAVLGTPKFQRVKEEMILTRLDARPKKEPPPEPPPPPPMSGFARGAGLRRAQG